jgi:hypothetical protein
MFHWGITIFIYYKYHILFRRHDAERLINMKNECGSSSDSIKNTTLLISAGERMLYVLSLYGLSAKESSKKRTALRSAFCTSRWYLIIIAELQKWKAHKEMFCHIWRLIHCNFCSFSRSLSHCGSLFLHLYFVPVQKFL